MAGCVNALRCLVFAFNLLFWLAGIATLGLGLWLIFDPSASDFFALHSANEGSYRTVAWLLIAAGAIMTFIGCFGCCGAWKLSQGALMAFFFVLLIVFCLELAAAIVAYNKQETIRQYVETSIYDTIRNRYGNDENHKKALDYVQSSFECCGAKSYLDWLQASWDRKAVVPNDEQHKLEHGIGAIGGGKGNGFGRVPASCCNELGMSNYPLKCGESFTALQLHTYADFIHAKGCSDALHDWIYSHLDFTIALCVITGIIQLLGMALAMILCCCINQDDRKEKYDY